MAVATVEEPMLSRLDRLDHIVRHLEEIRGGNRTPKSSCASTPSTSDGHASSSVDFSPRSLEKQCRPMDDVMVETGVKGTLIDRLLHVEDRVAKLCMQFEEEIEAEKRRLEQQQQQQQEEDDKKKKKKKKKKGLKQLVTSCVTGNHSNQIS